MSGEGLKEFKKEKGKLKPPKINENKNYFYLKPHIGVAATPN